MELLVRAGGFAESAKQENVVIVRYEGSTASQFCSITKRSFQAKKWNRTFCCEIATSSSFHSASKQKNSRSNSANSSATNYKHEADRGDHPRSCEIEWFVGFLSLGVIVLTVLFTYTTPISHRAESCARHSLKSARFSKSKIALRCSYDHHTRCPLAV
jgi:hypothetical protein